MATKLADLDVAAITGAWTTSALTMTAGSKTVTLRRKSDGAVLATRAFTVGSSSVAVSDNFNRANGALGANWATSTGASAFTISGSVAVAAAGVSLSRWAADTFAANQYSQGSGYEASGPAVRVSASAVTCYAAKVSWVDDGEGGYDHYLILLRVVAGTETQIGSYYIGWNAAQYSDVMRLEASGTSITVKYNGTTRIGPVTDSNIASGSAGMYGSGNMSIDDWAGGDL